MQGGVGYLFTPEELERVKSIVERMAGAGLVDYAEGIRMISSVASESRWRTVMFYANWREEGVKIARLIRDLGAYSKRSTF